MESQIFKKVIISHEDGVTKLKLLLAKIHKILNNTVTVDGLSKVSKGQCRFSA